VTPGSLLASADLALARAEAGAPFGAAAELATMQELRRAASSIGAADCLQRSTHSAQA
jgi:hypothetical protein